MFNAILLRRFILYYFRYAHCITLNDDYYYTSIRGNNILRTKRITRNYIVMLRLNPIERGAVLKNNLHR